jgi:adenylate cyclase
MNPGTEQRRLAAIMFTDMVGYSALAQRSDALALELLEEHRRLLRSIFPRFNGTEIKTIGDAFFVEFQSALEGAQCAIEIQRALAKRNTDSPPDRHIQIRVGIHIGDVVHREGDVYGDGVNIASRIEPLAGAGGICVSVDVERQIRNALEARLEKLGPTELKNIRMPMELFRIVLPWERSAPAPGAPSRSQLPIKKAHLAVALFVVLALCGVGVWFKYSSGHSSKEVSKPLSDSLPAAPQAVEGKSVAVLPFVNMSADKSDEYLSDGMTEELLNVLAKVRGLRVPGRSSSFAFKGKNEEGIFRKVGDQLHVSAVLEGSVRKAGNQLRITAQLINVADGFHLWSETYDRDMTNIFAIQSDIAERVARSLKMQLGVEETQVLEKKPTENTEAYRLYLLGLSFWNQRTGASVQKAMDYFEQALAKDPNYALAHVGLANCYVVLPVYASFPSKAALPKARAAALAALTLDSTLGEAHAALAAYVKLIEWDWQGAEAEYRRAIELTPTDATAHQWYSNLLRDLGRFDEASREIQRALELDPLSPSINVSVGWVLYYQGHYEQAIAACNTALELNPNFREAQRCLADAYLMKQMFSKALIEFQKVRVSVGNVPYGLGDLGYAYGVSGRLNEAHQVLDELTGFIQQGYEVQLSVALVYYGLGDRDKTLDWLEKAGEAHIALAATLKVDPLFRNLRSEPRFIALLKKMGLEK